MAENSPLIPEVIRTLIYLNNQKKAKKRAKENKNRDEREANEKLRSGRAMSMSDLRKGNDLKGIWEVIADPGDPSEGIGSKAKKADRLPIRKRRRTVADGDDG